VSFLSVRLHAWLGPTSNPTLVEEVKAPLENNPNAVATTTAIQQPQPDAPVKKKRKRVIVTPAITPPSRSPRLKGDVALLGTHWMRITMVRAGKGDSYILSDHIGISNDDWKYILIVGGKEVSGDRTWSKIKQAMKALTGKTDLTKTASEVTLRSDAL
jgi:hypothetical protein